MGVLVFVCPATGDTVSTNLEIDGGSFASQSSQRFSQVRCPRCAEPHDLPQIANWLTEDEPAECRSLVSAR
jgi:hypothetical protein